MSIHPLTKDVPKPLAVPRHKLTNLPRPLQDRVLVRRIEEEETGLIISPEIAKVKSLKAEVLAVGPGKIIDGELYATQVKAGQIVFLSPGINRNWPDIVEGSGVMMIQEADILGVLEG